MGFAALKKQLELPLSAFQNSTPFQQTTLFTAGQPSCRSGEPPLVPEVSERLLWFQNSLSVPSGFRWGKIRMLEPYLPDYREAAAQVTARSRQL